MSYREGHILWRGEIGYVQRGTEVPTKHKGYLVNFDQHLPCIRPARRYASVPHYTMGSVVSHALPIIRPLMPSIGVGTD